MCWGVFFCIAVLHYLNFTDTDAKKRALGDCIFYAVLLAWFIGGMVNYAFKSA
jgi:formate-dependent nitrite reductase membrane component NrfD